MPYANYKAQFWRVLIITKIIDININTNFNISIELIQEKSM